MKGKGKTSAAALKKQRFSKALPSTSQRRPIPCIAGARRSNDEKNNEAQALKERNFGKKTSKGRPSAVVFAPSLMPVSAPAEPSDITQNDLEFIPFVSTRNPVNERVSNIFAALDDSPETGSVPRFRVTLKPSSL